MQKLGYSIGAKAGRGKMKKLGWKGKKNKDRSG
jgi:hypothetical protein